MTTDDRLRDLKQALAWAQLVGWNVMGDDQRKAREKVEWLKRQIELIENNRGAGGGQSDQ